MLTDVQVGATGVCDVELQLPPGGRIAGVVVDERGVGVGGAWIGARDALGRALCSFQWELRTDPTGLFHLESLAAGTYSIRARADESEGSVSGIAVLASETTEIRIVVR